MRNRKYDWRRLRRIAAAVLLLAGALSGCAARAGADSPWKFFTGGTDTEPLTAAFLKVGKADAIVLVHAGEALVIDCGEEEDGAEVVEYLKARNISRISALIITHFDQDHVGGADTVAEQMEIGRVLLPAYEGSGSEYADLLSALDAKGIEPELLAGPLTFRFGEAEVLVSPPDSYEVPAGVTEFDNNFSLITTVTHGKMRLVFAGDIEKQRIRAYLETGAAQKYYDTPDSLLIRRSLDKPLYKEKLRLRSYGIPSMDTTVYLEIKKKYRCAKRTRIWSGGSGRRETARSSVKWTPSWRGIPLSGASIWPTTGSPSSGRRIRSSGSPSTPVSAAEGAI